jgi:hypothetical protein
MARWVVHTKGKPNTNSWEICIIREDFQHGFRSYGWFGPHKHYVSSSGGPCHEVVPPDMWDLLVEAAEKRCETMNDRMPPEGELSPDRWPHFQ